MIKGIKICGVSDLVTLNFILNHKYPPKFVGFITNYEESKRYVAYENLKNLVKNVLRILISIKKGAIKSPL